jgi:hypothetical protein
MEMLDPQGVAEHHGTGDSPVLLYVLEQVDAPRTSEGRFDNRS